MSVRPVGVLLMEDNAGDGREDRGSAVCRISDAALREGITNYSDLPDITVKQIEHFFAHYKDLEPGKWVKILRWGGADEAHRLILEGIERCRSQTTNPSPLGGPQT